MTQNDAANTNSQVHRLLRDVFATGAAEATMAELEAQMVSAAAELLTDDEAKKRFPQLWRAFALDPLLEEEYQLLMAVASDEAAGNLLRPTIMPPLPHPDQEQQPLRQQIDGRLAQGQRWLHNSANQIYLSLAAALQPQPSMAWATRATETGKLLAQITNGGEAELADWEITVSVVAESTTHCRLTISLYNLQDPAATLAEIPLRLLVAGRVETVETDANGFAAIDNLPIDAVAEAVLRIDLND